MLVNVILTAVHGFSGRYKVPALNLDKLVEGCIATEQNTQRRGQIKCLCEAKRTTLPRLSGKEISKAEANNFTREYAPLRPPPAGYNPELLAKTPIAQLKSTIPAMICDFYFFQ